MRCIKVFGNIVYRKAMLVPALLLLFRCTPFTDTTNLENNIQFYDDEYHTPGTRTTMNGSTASFASGDQIGVFETLIARNNVLYNYGTPNWTTTTPMYWKNYTSQHSFYAYYPYNASYTNLSIPLPILSAQTVSSTPDPKCDLLVAQQNTVRISAVNLKFKHALTLFKFNISFASSILSTLLSSKITITGGNTTAGASPIGLFNIVNNLNNVSYNLSNNQLVISNNTTSTFQQSLTATLPTLISGSTTIYILALPGTYNNPAPNVKFTIKPLGLVEVPTSSPSLNLTTLQPNTLYEYNVQVTSRLLSRGDESDNPLELIITPVNPISDNQ